MPDRLAPGRYLLDPASSTVTLRHKTFWGLKTVPGGFGGLRASGEIAADGTAHGTLAIDAASLDTKHAKRDEHLRSAHFFDVEQHPEITFETASVTPSTDGTVSVEGDLTVRGSSRKLAFTANYEADGTEAVVVRGTVAIDRKAHGLTWNMLGMLTGPATVDLDLRFTAQP
jgi:polyisoprenoid-binding protein YceI